MTRTSTRRCATFAALLAWSPAARAAKVACVGDSITFGYGLGNPNTESYPAVLAGRLGSAHIVQNFGVSGATLLKNSDHPYWSEPKFTASHDFAPDVVVVMLGTNDAKPQNWSHKSEFRADYQEFIASYQALGALVYIATPPPVYPPGAFDIPPAIVANEVAPLVRTIAGDAQVPLIEVFTALSGNPDAFPDTVHPNAMGAELIAGAVLSALVPGPAASGSGEADSGLPSTSASTTASSSSAPGEPIGSSTVSSPESSVANGAGSVPTSTPGPSGSPGSQGSATNGVGVPPTPTTASSATDAAQPAASAASSVTPSASASSLPAAGNAGSASVAAPSVAASGSGAVPSADGLRSCDCRLGPSSATARVYHLWGALFLLGAGVRRLRSRA